MQQWNSRASSMRARQWSISGSTQRTSEPRPVSTVRFTAALRRYNSRMASSPTAGRTFRLTLDLFETGIRLMRENLRRADSGAHEQEIDRKLRLWLRERPGAEHGDSPGRLIDVDARLG